MEKDCVINPSTGRAVMANSRLGKKILKARKKEVKPPTQSPPANKRPTVKSKKPTEPKEPAPTNKRPRAEPKKEPKKAEPKKAEPKKAEPKKEPNQQYSKPIGPVKPKPKQDVKLDTDGGVKRKFDADYIKRYAKHIQDKYPPEGLKKALEKAKNGDEVKEFYNDYISGLNKKMISLGVVVDENLTKEEKTKLFKEDKLVARMYYRGYTNDLRNIKQDYLFKFEEPAE